MRSRTHTVGFRRRVCTGARHQDQSRQRLLLLHLTPFFIVQRKTALNHTPDPVLLYSKHFDTFPLSSGSTSNSSAPHTALHDLVLLVSLVSSLSIYPSGPTLPGTQGQLTIPAIQRTTLSYSARRIHSA